MCIGFYSMELVFCILVLKFQLLHIVRELYEVEFHMMRVNAEVGQDIKVRGSGWHLQTILVIFADKSCKISKIGTSWIFIIYHSRVSASLVITMSAVQWWGRRLKIIQMFIWAINAWIWMENKVIGCERVLRYTRKG